MHILLIRHGERHRTETDRENDANISLTDKGKEQANNLAKALNRLGIIPDLYLSNRYRHAHETATILAGRRNGAPSPQILSLCALTPKSPTSSFEDLLDEADAMQADLIHKEVVALVGHEPRLSQLLVRLTAQRGRPFRKAEVLCIQASSLRDFLQGKGVIEFQYPVVDYQETPHSYSRSPHDPRAGLTATIR